LAESQGRYAEAESYAQQAVTIYLNTLGEAHPNTVNALLTYKGVQVQSRLHCDQQTLAGLLQALAQQAGAPSLNESIALQLLEEILIINNS
jgi:hypothetical protein